MAIRMSELPLLIDSRVTVEVQEEEDTSPWAVEGVLIAISDAGVVVKNSDGSHILLFDVVIDVSKAMTSRKIIRRKLRFITAQQARQHLLDRHGVPWDLTKVLTAANAFEMHSRIDHSNLGHQHRTQEEEGGEE